MSKAACKYLLCGSDNAAADPVMMYLARAVIAGDVESTDKLDKLFLTGADLLGKAAAEAEAYRQGAAKIAHEAMAVAFAA